MVLARWTALTETLEDHASSTPSFHEAIDLAWLAH